MAASFTSGGRNNRGPGISCKEVLFGPVYYFTYRCWLRAPNKNKFTDAERVRTVFARRVTADTSVSGITADILREISSLSPPPPPPLLTPISSASGVARYAQEWNKNRESSRNKVPTRIDDCRGSIGYRSRDPSGEDNRKESDIFIFLCVSIVLFKR